MRLNSVACQRRLTVLSNVCDNSASNFKLLSAVTTPPCSCNGQKETGFYVTPKDSQKGKQQPHTHRELSKKREGKIQQKALLSAQGYIQAHNAAREKWDAAISNAPVPHSERDPAISAASQQ